MNKFAFNKRMKIFFFFTSAENTKLWILKYPLLALTGPGRVLSGSLKIGFVSVPALPAGAQRSGQHDRSGVDSLVETLLVNPSGEFSYQNRSHPLEAQLLMNTQELDLHHALLPARHIQPALRRLQENCCECWQCLSLERTPLCPFMRNSRFIYEELCRDRSDETHQLITGDYSDAAVPLGRPVWRL